MKPDRPDALSTLVVEHDAAHHCFQATVDGQRCVVDYRLDGRVLRLTHTGVPPPLEGRGVAAALVQEALAHARRHGLKVDPQCSYARGYMQRHPQTHDLLA